MAHTKPARSIGDKNADDTLAYEAGKRYLVANRDRLAREYAGEYVAILGDSVVDHGPSYSDLAERVFTTHGVRSILIQLMSESTKVVRVRRPSFLRRA